MRKAVCAAIAAFVFFGVPTVAFAAHAFKTRITIHVAADKSDVHGKVKSSHSTCVDSRSVNVYHKHHGRFVLEATISTDSAGDWASATSVASGTYKAIAPRATVSDGACKKAVSRALPVRRH